MHLAHRLLRAAVALLPKLLRQLAETARRVGRRFAPGQFRARLGHLFGGLVGVGLGFLEIIAAHRGGERAQTVHLVQRGGHLGGHRLQRLRGELRLHGGELFLDPAQLGERLVFVQRGSPAGELLAQRLEIGEQLLQFRVRLLLLTLVPVVEHGTQGLRGIALARRRGPGTFAGAQRGELPAHAGHRRERRDERRPRAPRHGHGPDLLPLDPAQAPGRLLQLQGDPRRGRGGRSLQLRRGQHGVRQAELLIDPPPEAWPVRLAAKTLPDHREGGQQGEHEARRPLARRGGTAKASSDHPTNAAASPIPSPPRARLSHSNRQRFSAVARCSRRTTPGSAGIEGSLEDVIAGKESRSARVNG